MCTARFLRVALPGYANMLTKISLIINQMLSRDVINAVSIIHYGKLISAIDIWKTLQQIRNVNIQAVQMMLRGQCIIGMQRTANGAV